MIIVFCHLYGYYTSNRLSSLYIPQTINSIHTMLSPALRRNMRSRRNYINFIPQEILTCIFLYLPATSLGLCKCVSKLWNSLISDPTFIKTHVTKTSTASLILVAKIQRTLHYVRFDKNNPDSNAFHVNFNPSKQCKNKWSMVWGSCHGLVLVEDRRRNMFLINPTTLEYKMLPLLPCRYRSNRTTCNQFGFGYDSYSDDYVVVAICYKFTSEKGAFVFVYTLKTKQWKEVGLSPFNFAVNVNAAGIFVGGFIYWLTRSYNDFTWLIAAFDVANKKFSRLSLPDSNFQIHWGFQRLGLHEGCLCIINTNKYKYVVELWKLENGVFGSCLKLSIDKNGHACFLPSENNIVVPGFGKPVLLISSAKECSMYMFMKATGLPNLFEVGMTYVESLVSPNDKDDYKNNRRRLKTSQSFK